MLELNWNQVWEFLSKLSKVLCKFALISQRYCGDTILFEIRYIYSIWNYFLRGIRIERFSYNCKFLFRNIFYLSFIPFLSFFSLFCFHFFFFPICLTFLFVVFSTSPYPASTTKKQTDRRYL